MCTSDCCAITHFCCCNLRVASLTSGVICIILAILGLPALSVTYNSKNKREFPNILTLATFFFVMFATGFSTVLGICTDKMTLVDHAQTMFTVLSGYSVASTFTSIIAYSSLQLHVVCPQFLVMMIVFLFFSVTSKIIIFSYKISRLEIDDRDYYPDP